MGEWNIMVLAKAVCQTTSPRHRDQIIVGHEPRVLARRIMAKARYIGVNIERIAEIAAQLAAEPFFVPTWDHPDVFLKSSNPEEIARFFLIFNSINYCYFHMGGELDGMYFTDGERSGSMLAAARVTHFWSKLRSPVFASNVTKSFVQNELFAAAVPLPLLSERVRCLREVGQFLESLDGHGSSLLSFVRDLRGDAAEVAKAIPRVMPSWSDPFLKRAQLFVAQVFSRLQNSSLCPINSRTLERLTVFADYRLPQTLFAMDILRGEPEVFLTLARHIPIPTHSELELEIRAATIVAGDLLIDELNRERSQDSRVHALHVDNLLWKIASGNEKNMHQQRGIRKAFPEFHRTVTTEY